MCPSFLWTTNSNFMCGQAYVLNFFSRNKMWKEGFFPYIHFSNDWKLNVLILIAPTYRWDRYVHFCVWKRWGYITYQSTSKSQSWVSRLVTKKIVMMWNRDAYFFLNLKIYLYGCLCPHDMVWNISITEGKISWQKCYFT